MMFDKRNLLKKVDFTWLGDTDLSTRDKCSELLNVLVERDGKRIINELADETGLCRQTIINLMEYNGPCGPMSSTTDEILNAVFKALRMEMTVQSKETRGKKLKLVA